MSHIVLDTLRVFLLCLGIALKELDKPADIVYLVVLNSRVGFQFFDLIMVVDSVETSLSHPFELHFQKGHVCAAFTLALRDRQILEVGVE